MKKWLCKVCGYIYEGPEAPAECPVCHAKSNMFEEVKGELKLAAEHEFGVYGKTVKNNPDISEEDKKYIFDQLMANFNGECSEVGMYLCMARVAHREGYPEIGLYWEKAAYEEAEHAAKFAEMLGSDLEPNMKASTKDNLKWRVDCEFGATSGKFDLALCAKKNGLDAIHDTVHEMARDEAIILMVESNLQRSVILPSEKAFSYKMRLEAMNRQGQRTDLTSVPVAQKSKTSREELGAAVGESQDQVRRYIRLTELIPELLDLVDEGRIAFRPAVELSYLQKEEQGALLEQIAYADATPSLAQAIKLKRFSQDGKLNNEVIESIMSEEKPNQREKINIKYAEARRFIPASIPYEKTGEYILKALEYYHRYQERQKSRNDAR